MSRQIYQRMLTYTLNKIIKTLQISLLLGVGLAVTKQFILSQLLIVLLLFANDFMTMSIATDRVSYSQTPNKWDIKKLMMIGGVFALLLLGFSFAMHFVGISLLHLSIGELRTWIFLLLVFTGQATVYLARERLHFWHSKPSRWMVMSTILDISIISLMALKGWLMAPILPHLLFALFISVVLFFFLIDLVKPRLLRFFQI